MTGLSILFNLNTDEACYVYGHMESHRRANEHSIQQRYSDLLSPGRQRNAGDLRYPSSSDITSYTPSYSDSSSRYRSGHGFTDFHQEPYATSPTLSGRLYSDGDSMSKYTRGYDITNRNSSDFTSKGYDSTRLYEHTSRPISEVISPPFEFGVSYKTPKSHDISTKTYDRSTGIGDVTARRSPARTTSISDRNAVSRQAHVDPPVDRWQQRLGSSDSSGSQSSERPASAEDKSLFGALKNRYQETAEKQYEDPSSRTPFSSWRRSGNFEDVTSPIAPETKKEKTKSLERKPFPRDEDKIISQKGFYHDESSGQRSSVKDTEGSRTNVKETSALKEKQPEKSTDELIFNFRQAFCRHALSEKEKSLERERTPSSTSSNVPNLEDDATAQRLERLRAARAKIHEQRQSEKIHSQSFATEFKIDKAKLEKSRSGSTSSVSSQKSDKDKSESAKEKHESGRVVSQPQKDKSYFEEAKAIEHKDRHSKKLARQKLVSDDLKAKYMIKREDDDKEKTPTPSDEGSRIRTDTRHNGSLKAKQETDSVPSMEEMLLGSPNYQKTSSLPTKIGNVDHSSPFGSVYSKPSTITTTTTISSTLQSPTITTFASSYSQPEKYKEKSQNEKPESKETTPVNIQEVESKEKGGKRYKKYAKATTVELGALSKHEEPETIKTAESKDDISVEKPEKDEQASRFERIAKYKEERRKQIKTLQDKFSEGGGTDLPSLFLSSKAAKEEDASVSRSKSMKVESDNKPEVSSNVTRSKSLKQDKDLESSPNLTTETHKMPGLRLAEIGSHGLTVESSKDKHIHELREHKVDADDIIDKIHALKKLKAEQLKRASAILDENVVDSNVAEPHEMKTVKPASYASKALLADRMMEEHPKAPSPIRDRIRSHSKERDIVDKSDKTQIKPEQKSYFEFGTVFTKKETKVEKENLSEKSSAVETKQFDDKDTESGRESADSSSRIRRRLPSIEDVLGTNVSAEKFDKLKKDAQERRESQRASLKELTKEELATMSAEEINKRKVADNIEKAKLRFKEEEKNESGYGSTRFELGTVYTPKKVEKVEKTTENKSTIAVKQTEQENKHNSLKSSKQEVTEKESVKVAQSPKIEKKKSHKIAKKEKEVAQTRDDRQLSQTTPVSKNITGSAHISRKEASDRKLLETVEVETKEKVAEEKTVVNKPPSSPRNERKKQAEQKFGKVSYRSNEAAFEFGTSYTKKELVESVPIEQKIEHLDKELDAMKNKETEVKTVKTEEITKPLKSQVFEDKKTGPLFEFGTSYVKKEPVIAKPMEKATNLMEETTKKSLNLTSPKAELENKPEKQTELPKTQIPIKTASDAHPKYDLKVQTMSTATGRKNEVPVSPPITSPKRMSPVRTFADSYKGISTKTESVVAQQEVKPMKLDVKSSKIEQLKKEPSKVVQSETVPSLEKKPTEEPKQEPARQTSVTSLEIKSPTQVKSPVQVKSPEIKTEIYEKVKPSSGTPKERSEFTFEGINKQKPVAQTVVPEKHVQKEVNVQTPNVEIKQTKAPITEHKKEEMPVEISVVEMNKRLMEEKINQQKLVFVPSEEKVIDKHEKKSELFELHMKQIAEKIEPKHISKQVEHVEEKVSGKHEPEVSLFELHRKQLEEKLKLKHVSIAVEPVEEKPIEKHDIDSELFKMHKQKIAEKLELKDDLPQDSVKPVTKEQAKKPERGRKVIRHRHDKHKGETPVQTKVKMEKSLMDTSLDDILSKNVEYLSDLEPVEFKRGKSGDKKERPQSIHEPHRGKRILKKKAGLRRSKSEDRSHFKVVDSDEESQVIERSKVTEDLPQSLVKVAESYQQSSKKTSESRIASHSAQPKLPDVSSTQAAQERGKDKTSQQNVSSGTRLNSQHSADRKPVSKQQQQQSQTGTPVQNQAGFQIYGTDYKQKYEANQSIGALGIEKPSPSISQNIYGRDNSKNTLERTADIIEMAEAANVTDRQPFQTYEGEVTRVGTDSDHSSVSSSAMSDGSKKRRKDKSSLRKSKLNESGDDTSASGRRKDSSDDSSQPTRTGVRRVSSSRLARETTKENKGDQQEVFDVLKIHDLEITLTKPGTSLATTTGNHSADKHVINTDHKHLNNIESPRIPNKSVLDSHSVLPSRFALPSKVSAVISKLTESSDKETSHVSRKTEDSQSSRSIRRGNNFSQLLQKFSGSEASSSEKSDSESPRRNKLHLTRQEACKLSSSSSDETRRTPERTQSLKLRVKDTATMETEAANSVQRSSSFKSDFMKRRFSPEPETRRRLPETPDQSDKLSPELAKVLSKRTEIVAKQQEEAEAIERQRIHDGKIEKSDKYTAGNVEDVIADSEVVKMLKSRRKETDSSVETSISETEKSQKMSAQYQKPQQLSQSSTESDQSNRRLQSQSSVESKLTVNLTSKTDKEKVGSPRSHLEKQESAKTKSQLPHLDLRSIDTSLDVLKSVTADLDDTKHDKSTEKLTEDLSHLKVTSPTQVAQFIKSVESDSKRKQNEAIVESKVQLKSENVQRPSSPPPQGSINITNKSEIMRKISKRDRTPERQSPKRSVPMKVMTPASAAGPGLTRTESVGRSESERPKGILKRSPSLKQSGVIVDPELAEVLKSRRHRHEEEEEEEEEKKLTAEEEIRQASLNESRNALEPEWSFREEALSKQHDDDEGREVSVAERIFQMHNKIEEVKSCPITPKPRSGFTTPKSALQRSGNISPKQFSFEEENKQPGLSGSQLIEKLSSLEGRQTDISEKRQKFLNRRRDDARTRTQPVTQLEIQSADNLETVKKFRREIIQKASTNVFEALQNEPGPEKKTEFPHELRLERRQRGQRHKTQPVTADELNAIPEDKPTETMYSLRKKFDSFGARDSKADSGILSGSDGEIISHESESWRSLSVEENIGEDDPVKLSVSAKASMFHQIQESLKEKQEKKSASGAKRYIDRKKRERSRTLPITEDEVKLAAEIADKEEEEESSKGEATLVTLPTEGEGDDAADELSRQSLRDKVKLFTSIEEEKKAIAQKKGIPPPPKRKSRKLQSRFATQPVTYEEVEKAAKISPLACSLVKPPDPEILSGLSVKAQRELIAQHAQQTLSQPGSRAGSRVPSRATSIGDLSEGAVIHDAQTISNTDLNANANFSTNANTNQSATGIETSYSTDSVIKPSQLKGKGFEVKRTHSEEYHSSQITEKVTVSNVDSQKKSMLKSQLEEKLSLLHKAPAGLLRPNSNVVPTISEINKVLKKETASSDVKGILKREGSFESSKMEVEGSAIYEQSSESMTEIVQETESDENVIDSSGDNLDSDEGVLEGGDGDRQDTPVKRREAKSRRRFNRERKLEQERYRTQPAETTTTGTPESEVGLKKRYSGRHFTQPVTPDEKKEAEIATEMPEVAKTGSISDRLNALKKSGDEEWKKRVSRPVDLDRLDRRSASPEITPPTAVKMREKKGLDIARPSSIADRLSLLDNAQEGWRDRVGETDVKKFTIEHKISASGQSIGESPLVARLRGKTSRTASRDSESSENSELMSPTSPTKPLPKEIVCTDLPAEMLVDDSKSPLVTSSLVEEEKEGTTVEVPEMGAELDSFFQRTERHAVKSEAIDVSVDDFNELFLSANDMLEAARRVKPKRRYNTKSRNPLKTMSACLEVKSEYTEVIHGVAERELKHVKVAALQQNSGFAVEALAGLASKENFAKVELRKTESNGAGTSRLDPYLPLMLIHIKGRRKVQCRLVEPKAESINSGDCYVLVTPDKVIQWLGDYCNVIEKAKAADICDFVKQKRDLGCKSAREVTTVEEKKGTLGNARQFWDLLGGHKPYMACGPPEEDELYETHIVETNMIYRLENNKLVPVQDVWGNQPKYEMLTANQVYVFDFGSELYLWQGKAVAPNQRKVSLRLAEQLWQQGYDYSQCEINPLSPLRDENDGGLPNKSDHRPDWALFGKVNQNMETILFREKFADWPDTSRLIKVKSQEDVTPAKVELADLKAYDAKLMVPVDTRPVSMVLEGSNVGRGVKWLQDMEGFVKEQEIQTLKVRVWHVLEYDHYEIEDHSYGQFHEGDTYVVRWQYMIVNAGMKSLKGEASRFGQAGRERCAYFFWQGKSSTINEKGASALMTVELDEERGPQVRVPEGKEPPCFLNLFQGRMIIHIGKREEEETNTQGPWRFYCLRNEFENEMCLIEVPKDISNLRSVSSCLILNIVTGKLTVWHGCKSPDHTRKLAKKAAENLLDRCPLEVGLHDNVTIEITEVEEGQERVDFWRMMNVHIRDRSKYHCLLDNPESFSHTLRLFRMTSVSGVFEAHEILNPSRTDELPTKFPVLQADLYIPQQPALFLVDNGHEIYLWQGWWPEGGEDQENVLTGSAQTRFMVDRRCAMETTLEYCKEINSANPPPAFMVYAGLEPLSFTNLFPFWTVDESVREINLRDGKTEGELMPVQDLLKKLTKTRYTLAELLEIPLPEGVDPLKLESYLSDEEFQTVLEMTREEFYVLPSWKQQKLKQQASLF